MFRWTCRDGENVVNLKKRIDGKAYDVLTTCTWGAGTQTVHASRLKMCQEKIF